jgi:hypothetical protein
MDPLTQEYKSALKGLQPLVAKLWKKLHHIVH